MDLEVLGRRSAAERDTKLLSSISSPRFGLVRQVECECFVFPSEPSLNKASARLTRSAERVNPVVSAAQAHRGIHFPSQRHNRAGLEQFKT